MNRTDVMGQLSEIFREIFRRHDLDLTAATTAEDVPGWDSFKQIEIAIAAEERFGVRLRTQEMSRLKNVGELAELISRKLAADE